MGVNDHRYQCLRAAILGWMRGEDSALMDTLCDIDVCPSTEHDFDALVDETVAREYPSLSNH